MHKSLMLRRLAVLFVAICLLLSGWYVFTMPKTLRVAVGPADSPQHRYLQAAARALIETQQPFRLKIMVVADSAAAGSALDARTVDLAVLRSDDATSAEAQAIALLSKRTIVIAVRKGAGISSMVDLKGRATALIAPRSEGNLPIIERIAQHYGIPIADLLLEEIDVRDLAKVEKIYAAYILISDPASGASRTTLDAIAGKERSELDLIGMAAPEGLVLRLRALQKVSIPVGAFGGSPPQPMAALETVAYSYELTARSNLSQTDGRAFLSALVDIRTRLRRHYPGNSFDIQPPPIDEQRRFLPHIGAVAYVNEEDAKTFLDTYSDYIWLFLFALSIIGSSVTGYLGWTGFFDTPIASNKLPARIAALAKRIGMTDGDADGMQAELDDIVITFLREYGRSSMESEAELSLALWTSSLGTIIERRRALARSGSSPADALAKPAGDCGGVR